MNIKFVLFLILIIAIFPLTIHAVEMNRLAIFPFAVKNAGEQQVANTIMQTTAAYIQQRDWYILVADAPLYQALQRNKIKPQEVSQAHQKGLLTGFTDICDYGILGVVSTPEPAVPDVDFIVSLQFIRISDGNALQSLVLPGTWPKLREVANAASYRIIPSANEICLEIQRLQKEAAKKQNWEQVIELSNWFLRINSQTHIPYYNRGQAYEELMYLTEALKDYQTALQLATNEEAAQLCKNAFVRIQPKMEEMNRDRPKLLEMIDQTLKPLMQNYQAEINLYSEVIQDIQQKKLSNNLEPLMKLAQELKADLPGLLQELRTAHAARGSNQKLVLLVQKAEQYEKKRVQVDTALATQFQDMEVAYIEQAIAAQKESRWDAALVALDKGLIVVPDSPRLYYLKGMTMMTAKDFNKAVEWFATAITYDANYTPAYLQRGQSYLELSQFEKALPDLQKAASLDPKNPQINFSLGEALYALNRDAQALNAYTKTIALDTKFAMAYFQRGKIYDRQMLYLNALQEYQKASTLSSGLQAKAAPFVLKIKEYLLKDAQIYVERGIQEIKNGDALAGIAFLNTSLEYNPKNADAYFQRGICHQMKNDHKKALADFNQAFQLKAAKDIWYYQRALSHQKLGNPKLALDDLQKAVQLNSAFHQAYQRRGQIFEQQRNYTQALMNYETAIRVFPTRSSYYMDAARILAMLGKHEQAQNYMVRGRQYQK